MKIELCDRCRKRPADVLEGRLRLCNPCLSELMKLAERLKDKTPG